jgi:hypothetical protein
VGFAPMGNEGWDVQEQDQIAPGAGEPMMNSNNMLGTSYYLPITRKR